MRPKWLKVRKSYQGGVSPDDYVMLHPDDNAEEAARSWANKSPGGHSYGWTVHWSPVDSPPVEWLDKKIASLERQVKAIDSHIVTMEDEKDEILEKIRLSEEKIVKAAIDRDEIIEDMLKWIRNPRKP